MRVSNCENIPVEMEFLGLEDFDLVSSFLNSEKEFIAEGFFYMPSEKILIDCLTSKLSIVAKFENMVVGVRLTFIPGKANWNHGIEIGLSEARLNQVAQFHGTVIKYDMRSNGLGSYLVRINSKQILDRGFDYILVTVHPQNTNSLKMFLRNEFCIKCLRTKYNGLPRYILLKERNFNFVKDNGEQELIDLNSLSLISRKLESGFEGVGITKENKLQLRFCQAVNKDKRLVEKASV